jgi:lysophospholipase L1-like esterase
MSAISRRKFLQTFVSIIIIPELMSLNTCTSEANRLVNLFRQNKPLIYVFSGDSVTQGALHTKGMRCFPEIFAERIRWEMQRTTDFVVNSGLNGTDTSFLLNEYDWCIAQFKPGLVSIMFGINDCQAAGITPSVFEKNLELIVEKTRNINAIPILQTPNAIDEEGVALMKTASRKRLPDYVEVIRKVAKNNEVVLVDNWKYWNENGLNVYKQWLDDPLHPNAMGHIEIARLLFRTFSIFDPSAFTCSEKF